eukprot:TRINITY_DN67478_c0_g1_i1.p1 TRINITY_DN67478_c0_g1~~TRINITY_DN67478_c0_g1_i1.p1  ORF type:complete len:139 (+),score=36.93 TRINITY_DN67478_c0_g1_i1:81-497(+)
MGGTSSRARKFDDPLMDLESEGRVPWKMGTVEYTIPDIKHWRGAKPGELQHPALRHCRETRMHRNTCLHHDGNCEYKIEAHFQCLEQFYPKEKVAIYRSKFRDQAFENYEVIDNLMARAPFYYISDFNPDMCTPNLHW